MNARYIALAHPPRAWTDNYPGPTSASRPTITVHEDDSSPEYTGLLDARGVELFRVRERVAMGFEITGEIA